MRPPVRSTEHHGKERGSLFPRTPCALQRPSPRPRPSQQCSGPSAVSTKLTEVGFRLSLVPSNQYIPQVLSPGLASRGYEECPQKEKTTKIPTTQQKIGKYLSQLLAQEEI